MVKTALAGTFRFILQIVFFKADFQVCSQSFSLFPLPRGRKTLGTS